MSVFTSLTQEHGLLRGLVRRLRRGLDDPDERFGRREARNLLLVLLRALSGHEEFEDAVFQAPFEGSSREERKALAALARQHAAISRLRDEIRLLLQGKGDVDLRLLRPLAERLERMLDAHFLSEERELWPQLKAVDSRAARGRADRAAADRLARLKKEVAAYWAAVEDYLASDS